MEWRKELDFNALRQWLLQEGRPQTDYTIPPAIAAVAPCGWAKAQDALRGIQQQLNDSGEGSQGGSRDALPRLSGVQSAGRDRPS
eukprot:COSAG01_NODE_15128_length_1371_cov_4.272799_1_plen_84_part_10